MGLRSIILSLKGSTIFLWEVIAVCITILALFIGLGSNIFNKSEISDYGSIINPVKLIEFCESQINFQNEVNEISIDFDTVRKPSKFAYFLLLDKTSSNTTVPNKVKGFNKNMVEYLASKDMKSINNKVKSNLTHLITLCIATIISNNERYDGSSLGAAYYCNQKETITPINSLKTDSRSFFTYISKENTSNRVIEGLCKPIGCKNIKNQQTDFGKIIHDINDKVLLNLKEKISKDKNIIIIIISDLINDVEKSEYDLEAEIQKLNSKNKIFSVLVISPDSFLKKTPNSNEKSKREELIAKLSKYLKGKESDFKRLKDEDFKSDNMEKTLTNFIIAPEDSISKIRLYYPRVFLGDNKNYSSSFILTSKDSFKVNGNFAFSSDNSILKNHSSYLKIKNRSIKNHLRLFLNKKGSAMDFLPNKGLNEVSVGNKIDGVRFNNYYLDITLGEKKLKKRIKLEFVEVMNKSFSFAIIIITWALCFSFSLWISSILTALIIGLNFWFFKNTKKNYLLLNTVLSTISYLILQICWLHPKENTLWLRIISSLILFISSLIYFFSRRRLS